MVDICSNTGYNTILYTTQSRGDIERAFDDYTHRVTGLSTSGAPLKTSVRGRRPGVRSRYCKVTLLNIPDLLVLLSIFSAKQARR